MPDENRGEGFVKSVKGMLLLAAYAVTIVLIVGGSMIHRKPEAKIPQPIPVPNPYAPPPEPMEPTALAALEAFFEGPDLPTKAALVRDAARVRPMIEDFHGTRGHPFPTLGRVSPGQSATIDAKPMVMFEVEPFSGPRYFVAVVWDGRRFAVDWESLTAYGTMDWANFIEEKTTTTQTLRLYAQDARNLDEFPWTPEGNSVFRISHRDDPQPVTATADAKVSAILAPWVQNQRVPVTLEMEWQPIGPGQAKLAVIKRVVARGWSP